MEIKDIFYILGSVFFAATTLFLVVLIVYSVKIMRNFSKVSSAAKDISMRLQEKVDAMSGILAIGHGLLEKLAQGYFKKREARKVGKK